MFDVITIGSATKDVFLISKKFKVVKSDRFSTGFGECLPLGSKVEVDDFVETTGGGGTNTAATFANLGFKTATVTRIGNDASGKAVLDDLAAFGVSTKLVRTLKQGNTGYGVQLTTPEGERSVLVHRGVSASFSERDVPASAKAKWFYISSLAGDISLVKRIAGRAAKKGTQVAYNPGSLELNRGLRAIEAIRRDLTVLNMNLEEAQLLTKSKSRDIQKLCRKIADDKLILIITDGTNGAYAYRAGEAWHARTTGMKSISRTGAGDAFGAGFVAGQMKGLSIDDSLRVATVNAEGVIQKHGAKFGLLKKWPSASAMRKIKVRKMI